MITSTVNAKVKRLVALREKRRARDAEGVFLVEGLRMFREVPPARLRELYVAASLWERERASIEEVAAASGAPLEILDDRVFSRVSDTRTPQGVLCVVEREPAMDAARLLSLGPAGKPPLVLVLCGVQDPGNLGTMVRTAEAAGVTGVALSDACVDLYAPKAVRATMGSIFRVPCLTGADVPALIGTMRERGVRTYAAHLAGSLPYDEVDCTGGCAFLIGNEGNGLPDEIAHLAEARIKIPMAGEVESLNAAVSAAVLMFEASRQRRSR